MIKILLALFAGLQLISCSSQKTEKKSYSWEPYTKKNSKQTREIATILTKQRLVSVDPEKMEMGNFEDRVELKILIFGDSGTGKKAQYAVGKAMKEACDKAGGCDLALVMGDIIYEDGIAPFKRGWFKKIKARIFTPSEFEETFYDLNPEDIEKVLKPKFEKPYEKLGFDFWLVPGNHDWRGNIQKAINYSSISKKWKMPYNHYLIPHLPDWIKIYGLDTTRFRNLSKENQFKMEQIENKIPDLSEIEIVPRGPANFVSNAWGNGLVGELCKKDEENRPWRFAFGHHPIFTSGLHGKVYEGNRLRDFAKNIFNYMGKRFRKRPGYDEKMYQQLYPLLTNCKLDIYMSGHDHHQEHLVGFNSQGKQIFHQLLSGAAAKTRKTKQVKKMMNAKSLFVENGLGFTIMEVNEERADITYYQTRKPGLTEKVDENYDTELKKSHLISITKDGGYSHIRY